MTEAEAREWIRRRFPDRFDALSSFVDQVRVESAQQNLVSASTLDHIWSRHVVDSAQLVTLAPPAAVSWMDVGSGSGFPGIVLAILTGSFTLLVEPRRLRVQFLQAAVESLGLSSSTSVFCGKVERVATQQFDVITARAVMSLDALFSSTGTTRGPRTRYILPKGASVKDDLDAAQQRWTGVFHVEHSVLGSDLGIVVADRVDLK